MHQAEATLEVLKELGVKNQPIVTALNKIDVCEDRKMLTKLRATYPHTVQISALERKGFDELLEQMIKAINSLRKKVDLCIPQSHYALVSELISSGKVLAMDYEENDILMEVEIPSHLEKKVVQFIR